MNSEENVRRPRADAERNRQKLLDTASALIKQGKGELSLAAVAEAAGVGAGTLYRNFHNRDALLAALYRSEVERLHDAAEMLAGEMLPLEALRAWLGRYADLMAVKYGLADAMKSALKSDAQIFTHSRSRLAAALSALLAAAADAGVIRRDVEAEDLLIAVAAQVSASLGGEGAEQRRVRLLGLLMDGLRFGAEVPTPPAALRSRIQKKRAASS